MDAMRRYPENRSAFQSENGASRQKILNPLGSSVAAMSQEPVVAHADPQAARGPVKKQRDEKSRPRKEKQSCYRADVKQHHERSSNPIDFVSSRGFLL
jgi:hypothetical protein